MSFELKWENPVLIFYRERFEKPERKAFTVVKSKKLMIRKTKDDKYSGEIVDFFPLMGDLDYMSTEEGKKDTYVVCWFDDEIEDFDLVLFLQCAQRMIDLIRRFFPRIDDDE